MTTTLHPAGGPSRSPARNRRVTVRYRCAPATGGRVLLGDDLEYQWAWIDNLSRGGAGLFLAKPVPAGTPLTLQMRGSCAEAVHRVPGRVIHVAQREPESWYVGVAFPEPLDDVVLDALL